MCRLMTFLTSLLLALSAGCATYALGAITWCAIDPDGAGAKLLFTIPLALGGMTVPGILGALCLAFRCDFHSEPRAAKAMATTPAPLSRPRRPATAPAPATHVDDEMELALTT